MRIAGLTGAAEIYNADYALPQSEGWACQWQLIDHDTDPAVEALHPEEWACWMQRYADGDYCEWAVEPPDEFCLSHATLAYRFGDGMFEGQEASTVEINFLL